MSLVGTEDLVSAGEEEEDDDGDDDGDDDDGGEYDCCQEIIAMQYTSLGVPCLLAICFVCFVRVLVLV